MFINMDTNGMTIRDYEDSDKQRLLEIYDAAIPLAHSFLDEATLLGERQRAKEYFDRDDSQTFVLEIGGEVVGFSTLSSNSKNQSKMCGFVIDPQFQREGWGTILMKDIQKRKNSHTIKLAVYEKNQKAIDFYMKNGFEKTSPASPASETPESPKYLVMEWKK